MNRDPRYRARLNQLSSTLESANLNTQASLWTFKESYLGPCLTSVSTCLEAACYPCIGERRERARARQRRSAATARGRPEFVFDFYNDEWDAEGEGEDESTGLLGGWGADELDRLLAGSGAGDGGADIIAPEDGRGQPRRKPAMNYGATTAERRRRSTLLAAQGPDPTILPGSSMFGFLERLPWKIGGRGVKYKPSAADLQENLGGKRRRGGQGHTQKDSKGDLDHETGTIEETSALLEDDEEEDDDDYDPESPTEQRKHKYGHTKSHRRNRSDTTTSRSTEASRSSRGDLFPSEDEADDAVALDDSFALSFTRRSSDGEHDSNSNSNPLTPAGETTTDYDSPTHSQRRNTQSPSSQRPRKPTLSDRNSHRAISATPSPPPVSNRSTRPALTSLPRRAQLNTQSRSKSHSHTSSIHSEMALHSPLSPITPTGIGSDGDMPTSHNRTSRARTAAANSSSHSTPASASS